MALTRFLPRDDGLHAGGANPTTHSSCCVRQSCAADESQPLTQTAFRWTGLSTASWSRPNKTTLCGQQIYTEPSGPPAPLSSSLGRPLLRPPQTLDANEVLPWDHDHAQVPLLRPRLPLPLAISSSCSSSRCHCFRRASFHGIGQDEVGESIHALSLFICWWCGCRWGGAEYPSPTALSGSAAAKKGLGRYTNVSVGAKKWQTR